MLRHRRPLADGDASPGCSCEKRRQVLAGLLPRTHLRALALDEHIAPSKILVVGDAVDDAHAAMHVGAHCVLYDGGSHPVEELEATGLRVARTLTEALEIARVD